jgi:hypothetical protein
VSQQNDGGFETAAHDTSTGFSSDSQAMLTGDFDPERALMLQIYEKWHGYMRQATRNSSVPEPFVAALTANESGGDPVARAFEPAIFRQLLAVIRGQESRWGSLVAADLRRVAEGGFQAPSEESGATQNNERSSVAAQQQALRELATSWGLTQIMGYQLIHRKRTLKDLLSPLSHYEIAVELLEEFGKRFRLNIPEDAEALFRAWNTGRPDGKTSDPDYALRGIRRMRIYNAIVQSKAESIREDHA